MGSVALRDLPLIPIAAVSPAIENMISRGMRKKSHRGRDSETRNSILNIAGGLGHY